MTNNENAPSSAPCRRSPDDSDSLRSLACHERIIACLREYLTGLPIAYLLANDLRSMRDERLYYSLDCGEGKPPLKSFAEYIHFAGTELKTLNFTHRSTAYRVLRETDALVRISDVTKQLGDAGQKSFLSRAVLGEIAKLKSDHQPEVYLEAARTKPGAKIRPSDIRDSAERLYAYDLPAQSRSQSQVLSRVRSRARNITRQIEDSENEPLLTSWKQFLEVLNPPKASRGKKHLAKPVVVRGTDDTGENGASGLTSQGNPPPAVEAMPEGMQPQSPRVELPTANRPDSGSAALELTSEPAALESVEHHALGIVNDPSLSSLDQSVLSVSAPITPGDKMRLKSDGFLITVDGVEVIVEFANGACPQS